MKHRLTTFAPLPLLAALALLPGVARAQVSVDNKALEQLSSPTAAKPAEHPAQKPVQHPPTAHTAPHTASAAAAAAPVSHPGPKPQATAPHQAANPAAPPPSIPAAAPPAALVPPPPPIVATRPVAPPAMPAVVADAPGLASKINGGMRITFGADRTDLNAATSAAIRSMAHVAHATPTSPVNVLAYAAGMADDPSTPRRLALARALAARAVLVNEGIPSTRIYVRALGATTTAGLPADRVDVVVGPAPDTAPPPTPSPATSPAPAPSPAPATLPDISPGPGAQAGDLGK